MPFSATVFNVLIASPSDVPTERDIIESAIYDWNALHAKGNQKILLPVRWETHSYPEMGGDPQEILNRQLVRNCDMLIAAFWHRIGTPTGRAVSGTVEEIRWFVDTGKLSMLYYSDMPVSPSSINSKQLEELNSFKASIRGKGVQEDFRSPYELKEKLIRQLTIAIPLLDVAPSVPPGLTEQVRKGSVDPVEVKPDIWLEECSERSFAIAGDWKSVVGQLEAKRIHAQEVRLSETRSGLSISKKRLGKVAELFGLSTKLRPKS